VAEPVRAYTDLHHRPFGCTDFAFHCEQGHSVVDPRVKNDEKKNAPRGAFLLETSRNAGSAAGLRYVISLCRRR
jgi:hypothetical protein